MKALLLLSVMLSGVLAISAAAGQIFGLDLDLVGLFDDASFERVHKTVITLS